MLSHLWTLAIEEQFYLVWPLLLTMIWLLPRHARLRLMAMIAALSFASYGWTLFVNPVDWLLPWNRLWELALGAVLAYLPHAESTGTRRAWMAPFLRPPINYLLGMIGAVCLIVALAGPEPLDKWPSGYVWMPALGAFLVISVGPEQWINRRVLATRPMVFIGLISYPLYLWHWSLFMFAAILHGHASVLDYKQMPMTWKLVVIVASLILSYGTYRYIELPLRSSRNIRSIVLLLCIVMAVCGTAAYFALGGSEQVC